MWRVKKKLSTTQDTINRLKRARLNEKRDDLRWHKLLNEYYDLCDALGKPINREVLTFSLEILDAIVEVLREKKNCINGSTTKVNGKL